MRRRSALLVALLLAGCYSFVPGRGVLGWPLGPIERDRASRGCAPVFYLWTEAPDPRPGGWSPLTLLANALGSAALLPVSLFLVPLALAGCDGGGDRDDDWPRDLPPEKEERLRRALERGERDERARDRGGE
ncbi:MAG: hypothetical protein M9894_11530 [Planctomycetes bacterium]|nr:hypothetical protein [Planctomycetota bacterium]